MFCPCWLAQISKADIGQLFSYIYLAPISQSMTHILGCGHRHGRDKKTKKKPHCNICSRSGYPCLVSEAIKHKFIFSCEQCRFKLTLSQTSPGFYVSVVEVF